MFLLSVAAADMREAHTACQLFVEHVTDQGPLYRALQTAIIVSYARPFTQNRGLGALSAEWREFGEARRLRNLHLLILDLRNLSVAHGQRDLREVRIFPEGGTLPLGGQAGALQTAVRFTGLAPHTIPEIAALCEFQHLRISAAARHDADELYRDQVLPPDGLRLELS